MEELKPLIEEVRKYFPETELTDIKFLKVILQAVIIKAKESKEHENK